MLYVTATQ